MNAEEHIVKAEMLLIGTRQDLYPMSEQSYRMIVSDTLIAIAKSLASLADRGM